MNEAQCPHCGATNPSAAQFCEECGKAMPIRSGGPRMIEGGSFATSGAGRDLQAAELAKKANSAKGALIALAILMAIGGFLIANLMPGASKSEIQIAQVIQFSLAGIFLGLFFWARVNPFPAAVVGLVLIVSLWFINALLDPRSIVQGIIVKIIIIAVLSKAIGAGAQHRKLMREMEGR